MNKESILASARELIIKFGLSNLVMDDVARYCGISKKTIYKVFSSKDELIRELIVTFLSEERHRLKQEVQGISSSSDKTRYIIEFLYHIIEFIPYEHIVILRKRYHDSFHLLIAFYEEIAQTLADTIVTGQKEGVFDQRISPEILAQYVLQQFYFLQKNYVRLMKEDTYRMWKEQLNLYFTKLLS